MGRSASNSTITTITGAASIRCVGGEGERGDAGKGMEVRSSIEDGDDTPFANNNNNNNPPPSTGMNRFGRGRIRRSLSGSSIRRVFGSGDAQAHAEPEIEAEAQRREPSGRESVEPETAAEGGRGRGRSRSKMRNPPSAGLNNVFSSIKRSVSGSRAKDAVAGDGSGSGVPTTNRLMKRGRSPVPTSPYSSSTGSVVAATTGQHHHRVNSSMSSVSSAHGRGSCAPKDVGSSIAAVGAAAAVIGRGGSFDGGERSAATTGVANHHNDNNNNNNRNSRTSIYSHANTNILQWDGAGSASMSAGPVPRRDSSLRASWGSGVGGGAGGKTNAKAPPTSGPGSFVTTSASTYAATDVFGIPSTPATKTTTAAAAAAASSAHHATPTSVYYSPVPARSSPLPMTPTKKGGGGNGPLGALSDTNQQRGISSSYYQRHHPKARPGSRSPQKPRPQQPPQMTPTKIDLQVQVHHHQPVVEKMMVDNNSHHHHHHNDENCMDVDRMDVDWQYGVAL